MAHFYTQFNPNILIWLKESLNLRMKIFQKFSDSILVCSVQTVKVVLVKFCNLLIYLALVDNLNGISHWPGVFKIYRKGQKPRWCKWDEKLAYRLPKNCKLCCGPSFSFEDEALR